jgi:ectoine hydroxylase-related dioxygenase (phytanoyl-CoA dioxygenase family)
VLLLESVKDAATICQALDRDGYAVMSGYLPPATVGAMRAAVAAAMPKLPASGTAHCDALKMSDEPWAAVAADAIVVAVARHLLGDAAAPAAKAKYRAPLPGYGGQKLHIDWPTPAPQGPYVLLQVIIALTAFTEKNGATRVVPGTHKRGDLPPPEGMKGEARLLGPAGTIFLMNGQVWHAGARNDGEAPRDAVFIPFQVPGKFYHEQDP